jgi:ABC-type transport system involved in cytochrome c biogenesis permease subunit
MRKTITVGLVVVGFALMLIGFLAAAPWGSSTVADSDPVIVGAPFLFILGIVSVVAAAVLYELLPDRDR